MNAKQSVIQKIKANVAGHVKQYDPWQLLVQAFVGFTNYFMIFAVVTLFLWGLWSFAGEHDQAFGTLLLLYQQMNGEAGQFSELASELEAQSFSDDVYTLMKLNTEQIQNLMLKFLLLFSSTFLILFFVNSLYHFFMWGRAHRFSYWSLLKSLFSRLFLYYLLLNFAFFVLFLLLTLIGIITLPTLTATILFVILQVVYWYYSMLLRYKIFLYYKHHHQLTLLATLKVFFRALKEGVVRFFFLFKVLIAVVGLFILGFLLLGLLTYVIPLSWFGVISVVYILFFLSFARQFYTLSLNQLKQGDSL